VKQMSGRMEAAEAEDWILSRRWQYKTANVKHQWANRSPSAIISVGSCKRDWAEHTERRILKPDTPFPI